MAHNQSVPDAAGVPGAGGDSQRTSPADELAVDLVVIDRSHWQPLRELRLEMLADTPTAYIESLAQSLAFIDEEWVFRAQRNESPHCVGLAAADSATGRWVATMSAYIDNGGLAQLVTVYISPGYRGAGLAEWMLEHIFDWVRTSSAATEMNLFVHEQNARAIGFYERVGFATTGRAQPYPLDISKRELEMRMPVPPAR
ncbi:GNAT family N-acetyltransferase [Lysinibacter cavernae]|uniref:Ribosomal protein S18 acetylase RimI-like enzyme n=1 Tax=Lysinibacter cavernae TaxID=1640652 RepID=A0A7X5TS39_9MICO|nr:N-acetyltransferase [Lysinibacter cavernae]NIH53031.1 ribosomal protein S18 acetylase RimI-like enzyme [Lysinibacter cavernae]